LHANHNVHSLFHNVEITPILKTQDQISGLFCPP